MIADRRDEHALQTAEALATIASLKAGFAYPAQPFYQAWRVFHRLNREMQQLRSRFAATGAATR